MIRDKELLAPERLVRSGREILYEAVNTGRLVAFVGSGLSLVYGQPTWGEFIKSLRTKLDAAIGTAVNEGNLSLAEAGRMRAMATITEIRDSDTLVTLELIRRAYAQIQHGPNATPDKDQYREDLKSLFTFNAIAENLLSRRLKEVGVTDQQQQLISLFAKNRDLASVYNTKLFAELAEIGGGGKLKLLLNLLLEEPNRFADRSSSGSERALPIDRRSSLAIFLAHCLSSPHEVFRTIAEAINSGPAPVSISRPLSAPLPDLFPDIPDAINTGPAGVSSPKLPSRPLLDPLRELDEWLGLRRYLSTNYDLGLEDQHMVARDEAPLTPESLKRHNIEISDDDHAVTCQHRDGRVIRSDVNDGLHVAPLFDFALGGVDNSVHIYHLHGRVDRPETMIAADSEYNRLYRSEGLARAAFDHAYDTLIVGNPILFVGSGLTEADLNRVLRANVSNPDLLRAAPSIVLREAIKPQPELVLDQTQLATKLGVRVVYTGHARRGAAYTLRDHLMLVDYIAWKYDLAERKSADRNVFDDPPYRFYTKKPDFSNVKFFKIQQHYCIGIEFISSLIRDRFRLLHDLDYDRKIVSWLIQCSPDNRRSNDYNGADKLIADYLNMLAQKLISAALRHELRQIGHEAVEHYRERATAIVARQSSAAHDSKLITRHISQIPTLALPKALKSENEQSRYIAQRAPNLAGDNAPNFTVINRLGALLPPSTSCERTIILGPRGIGKGRLLAQLVTEQLGAASDGGAVSAHEPRRLFINCCYGQEIDSIVSIIDQFLGSPSADQSGDALSRRQRILANRTVPKTTPPLIVLGGVDRLFGTDGMPMSVEFEWLLDQLLDPERNISLLVTGELRCLNFFSGRLNTLHPEPQALRPGSQRPQTRPAKLWLIKPDQAEGLPNGFGLRAKLDEIAAQAHRPHFNEADRNTRLKMAHGAREADRLIGDWLATLEAGRARLPGCNADDQLAIEIVKVCAFIGLPFEADILPSVPAIRTRLREMFRKRNASEDRSAQEIARDEAGAIRDALARAMQLGLVSLVEPFGPIDPTSLASLPPEWTEAKPKNWQSCEALANWAIEHGYRLVVHRLTAKVLKDRFGVPNNAGVLSDSYSLSLYAVQPDDASVPEPRVTGELEDLIDYLMHSWKETHLSIGIGGGSTLDLRSAFRDARKDLTEDYKHDLSLHYLEALRTMRRRLSFVSPLPVMGLRAAGGVIRGYYSAVNLFGLDLGDRNRAPGEVSAISEHKQRIRTLLNLTIEAQKLEAEGSTPFDQLKNALDHVSGIVTVEDDAGDGALQKLELDRNIALLSTDDGIPEPWRRADPVAVKTFREKIAHADGNTLSVTGLRSLLGFQEPAPQSDKADERVHPFFDGEIVWLLNERAMLAMAQGDLYTAATTFELAFDANRKIEGDRYHPNRARLTINRAFLWIERGRIADARRELEMLRQHLDRDADAIGTNTNEGQLIAALCDGYIGLCSHLFGMLEEAESLYEKAISAFSAMRQQRAIAMFEHHRGALLRQIPGREIDAAAALQRGIAAATGGRHTDILYRLRIAKAHNQFFADPNSAAEVLATLGEAIDYGLSLEMHRVTVEALAARGQVHLKFGDIEAASRDISRAAAKAAQYGMTLRRIWLRVVTGQVYRLRGDGRNARKILERAVSEGSHLGYQRAVEVATRQLINLKTR